MTNKAYATSANEGSCPSQGQFLLKYLNATPWWPGPITYFLQVLPQNFHPLPIKMMWSARIQGRLPELP